MLNKTIKIEFMEIHACSSRFSSFFMLFQVNVVAQKKSERNHLNITGMKVELQITSNSTERIKC
jgi:hypothetical protein